ncbi:MAG: hypothetical protein B6U87_01675 [Candidatus Aenigmarchaeota archaeon ex4484_52]|nr:MAG: hypothetical protein B6U87_01675 [Candidatus Aenigmarchaeota archaeon ex4484_52]
MFNKNNEKKTNEAEDFKKQLLNRISMLNNMILDVKNELEKNTNNANARIKDIEKALNILDEDLFEISEKFNKREEPIISLTKSISDLKLFAKLSLKNSDLIKEQKKSIEDLRVKINNMKKEMHEEVLIPVKKTPSNKNNQKKK